MLVATAALEALAIQQKAAATQASSSEGTPWSQRLNPVECQALVAHCHVEGNRQKTGVPAPAVGLCLTGVGYEGSSLSAA